MAVVTVADMIRRFEAVSFDEMAVSSIEETKESLEDLQREQLLEGKNSEGNDITPSYLEDPFFKSREAAQRYSDWKDEITPHPKRKKGTPNLYINGYYHDNIYVKVTKDEIIYDNDASFDPDVEAKYGRKLLGLMSEKKQQYNFNVFWPVMKDRIQKALKLELR